MSDPDMTQRSDLDTVATDMTAVLADVPAPVLVASRYALHHQLGAGGAAVVREATDTRLDRRVAVKLLRETANGETDRARFLAEARLLAGLSHRHLVRVLDAGLDHERPFLVLELVRGSTLADVLDVSPLPPERVADLGGQLASALAHVHAAGVVHRDVKPGNLLLDEHGSARLSDFGIARLVDDTCHHTRTGTVVGTVAYLAPEQVAGERVTTAVDIYSLGLVLLEALTGARPYAGTSVESALARLSRQPEIPATLPGHWSALLTAMTARDPAARPTAAEVAAWLENGAAGPAPAAAPARLSLTPRLALVGVAAAFALLLAVAGWTSLTPPSGAASASAASAHRHPSATPRASAPATADRAVTESAPVAVPATTQVAAPPPAAQHRHQPRHHARHHARHPQHRPHHKPHGEPHHKPHKQHKPHHH